MRSKALFVANVLATAFAAYLLWFFGGALIDAGGIRFLRDVAELFDILFEILGTSSRALNFAYVGLILILAHVGFFAAGCVLGWLGWIGKKHGPAKTAAIFYLIGTLCFLPYFFLSIPVMIFSFIGSSKQKKLSRTGNSGEAVVY